LSSPVV